MKANLKNLVEVLKMRFDGKVKMKVFVNQEVADNVDDVDLKNDYVEIGIFDDSVPSISDARTIINCFFTNGYSITHVDSSWGFMEVFVSEGKFIRKKVDIAMLKMALPYDCEEKLKALK
jgi:hypothetical protein